jgi:hypothetical protein
MGCGIPQYQVSGMVENASYVINTIQGVGCNDINGLHMVL